MTGKPRHIGVAERRARLGLRQRLVAAARAKTPEEVADSLVALHGTDPATVYLAVGARLRDARTTVARVERALYEDRSLVRMHGMRNTVFVFPTGLAAVVHASTALDIAAKTRAGLVKDLAAGSDGRLTGPWLDEVEASALAALARRGQATVNELTGDEPRLKEQFVYAAGKSYESVQTVSSRLMRLLGTEGRVVRGRPLGSWTSSQFRWAVAPPHPPLPPAEARSALLNRWLTACGPATEADLKWWTGWKVTDVRRALAASGAVTVSLDDGVTAYVAAGDEGPVEGPDAPWAALLPALDPAPMKPAGSGLVPRTVPAARPLRPQRQCGADGVVGRTGGRGWAQRPDGDIVWRLLDTGVGREALDAISAEAGRLGAWVGDTRITPRFRTPLERELSAQ